jgi:hypothetical protein
MGKLAAYGLGLTLALILAILPARAAAETAAKPAAVAFYKAYLELRPSGVPGAKQRTRLRPLVSTALAALLTQAARAEARHRQKTKGEEPPLLEGDIFTSLFEGADTAIVAACEEAPPRATCTVDLAYFDKDAPTPLPVRWTDQVFLLRSAQGWAVDDIAYGGTWPFGHPGQRLTSLLNDVVREAREAK